MWVLTRLEEEIETDGKKKNILQRRPKYNHGYINYTGRIDRSDTPLIPSLD